MNSACLLLCLTVWWLANAICLTNTEDICGRYAVLIHTDEFYMTQPYSKTINVGFDNYLETLKQLELHATKFKTIADEYETVEKIQSTEPHSLIPFTNEKNLIPISTRLLNGRFTEKCKTLNAMEAPWHSG